MPEYPEIAARAREMNELLRGKTIAGVEVLQPKCLNIAEEQFKETLAGALVRGTTQRGKGLGTATSWGWSRAASTQARRRNRRLTAS